MIVNLDLPPAFPDETMWECLQDKGHLQVFIAEQQGNICYGLGVLAFNGILYEIGLAREFDIEAGSNAGDLVKWEIMRWGVETGQRAYDLAGVSPSPENAKEEGIRKFKAKFGGKYVEFTKFSKTYSPMKAVLLRHLKKLGGR